ncbi:MAG: hypothetical protein A2X61_00580 [Ignavibacteria bacterium GWB2_35_12]|nr:MAG: hypothetical protein A2X63_09835 [Ignavibacteria bacterium GWA2_35_8]OGU42612.1 MAG: hypothetical protein A2X61_00580 [Ignavibacteria bacterium GWB2_35_12]OGU96424.1 MAG: hypothetical protein A2220_07660 [Ignavibacteria bacterium RIFOXYA2_FULL_35_10]OGV18586.1 MAG: hypothetical protein A2475_07515 [Ignavibacteria bacterium RIFOXYC2_FULL_35_21]
MPELEENNLREEEKAGFQPGTPDDDSFLLDDKEEYPGELPEIPAASKGEAEEISSVDDSNISGIKVTEAEQIEVPKEGSIWEQFDGKKPEGETESGIAPAADETPAESYIEPEEAGEPLPPHVPLELDKEEEPVSLDKLSAEADESVAPPPPAGLLEEEEMPPKTEEKIEESEQAPQEPVKLDDDLAALIHEDLQKAKKRAEKVEEPKVAEQPAVQPTDEELQAKLDQFKPVEEKGETEMIDLMQVGAGEPAISEIEDAKPIDEVTGEAPKEEPVEEKKEKKKIIIPWKRVSIAAAAVLLLAVIGFGGYYFLWDKIFPPKEKESAIAQVKQKPKEIKKAETPKVVPKVDTAVTKPEAKEIKKEPDVAVTAIDIAPKDIKKPKPFIEKPKPIIVEKPKPVVIEKPKPVVVDKQKPVEKPVVATIEKKVDKIEPLVKPPVSEKKSVFAVQVYTTPSKDDAEDWMKILKRKNINGFISTQKMRDKIWYRVRFGFYNTREEARAAAEKLGFDQVWIDQIR